MIEYEQRVKDTEQLFYSEIENKRWPITPDGRVDDRVAAHLLGMATKTLSNYRTAGVGPIFYKNAGRIAYRVRHLAEYIESGQTRTLESEI